MYRTAVKRLFPALRRCNNQLKISLVPALAERQPPRFFNSAASDTIPNQKPTLSDSASPASASSAESREERDRRKEKEEELDSGTTKTRLRAHYQDEQARVLSASLPHVVRIYLRVSVLFVQ